MPTRSIPTNAAWLFVGRTITAAAAVVVAVVAARDLGTSGFGVVATVLAAGALANALTTFGTDTLVVRSVAAGHPGDDVGSSLGLQLVVLAGVWLVGAVAAVLAGHPVAVLAQLLAVSVGVWGTTATAVLRGRERMDLVGISMVAGALTAVAATIATRGVASGPSGYVAASALGQIVTAVTALRLARLDPVPTSGRLLWSRARPFATMVVATAAVASSAPLALSWFDSTDGAGAFGAANRVVEALRFAPAAAFGAAFPQLARGLHHEVRYQRGARWLVMAVAAVSLAIAAGAEHLVEFVFGDFGQTDEVLRVLAVGLIPLVLRLRWSFELLADGDEIWVSRASLVVAAGTVAGVVTGAALGGPVEVAAVLVTAPSVHAAVLGIRRSMV